MNRDTCGTCFAPSDLCKCTYTHEKLMEESAEYRESFYRFNKPALREAAQALLDAYVADTERWMTPYWDALREALREDALVRLSNTHQQLDEALEYEFIGTIDGTYAGRWMLAAFAENAAAVWPDNTAVYVRRIKQ